HHQSRPTSLMTRTTMTNHRDDGGDGGGYFLNFADHYWNRQRSQTWTRYQSAARSPCPDRPSKIWSLSRYAQNPAYSLTPCSSVTNQTPQPQQRRSWWMKNPANGHR